MKVYRNYDPFTADSVPLAMPDFLKLPERKSMLDDLMKQIDQWRKKSQWFTDNGFPGAAAALEENIRKAIAGYGLACCHDKKVCQEAQAVIQEQQ